MPETLNWFQWRCGGIVNGQAGVNMAVAAACGEIFRPLAAREAAALDEQGTDGSRRRYRDPPRRRDAAGQEESG
jgi:hypothetical protein